MTAPRPRFAPTLPENRGPGASGVMQPHRTSPTAPAGSSRMTLAAVTRGKQARPLRVLVYGVEGVGKSTFGAHAPGSVFLCAEDGVSHLDVARFPQPKCWADVLEAVRVLTHEEHSFKTLVVDTLDWLEPLCWQHVCHVTGKAQIEELPYGKGYVMAAEFWRALCGRLDMLVSARKMNVVFLAHSQIRKVDDPQAGAFDRYRLKLHEKSADVMREWVDAILFARHEVRAVAERNGKSRGVSSGHRILHTTWSAAFDAKNRFDLPPVLPLAWEDFEAAVKAAAPADPAKLAAEVVDTLAKLEDDSERAKGATALRDWAGTDPGRLAQLLDRVRAKVAMQGGEA